MRVGADTCRYCIQTSRSADRNANRHVVGADFCVAPIAPKRLSARAALPRLANPLTFEIPVVIYVGIHVRVCS